MPATHPPYDKGKMQFRKLGPSGLRVSLFSLGGWLTLGGSVNDELTEKMIGAAYKAGVTTFDTAEVYSNGESERAMGKAIKNLDIDRSSLVLITKIYFGRGGTDPNATGLSRKHIIEAADESLQRSGLKYWDVILAHQPDPTVPMEEVVRSFNRLIESDRCVGCSGAAAGVYVRSLTLLVVGPNTAASTGAHPRGRLSRSLRPLRLPTDWASLHPLLTSHSTACCLETPWTRISFPCSTSSTTEQPSGAHSTLAC